MAGHITERLVLRDVKFPAGAPLDTDSLKAHIIKKYKLHGKRVIDFRIVRKSIDARNKKNVLHVFTFEVTVYSAKGGKYVGSDAISTNISREKAVRNSMPPLSGRPIICDSGPAGMYFI